MRIKIRRTDRGRWVGIGLAGDGWREKEGERERYDRERAGYGDREIYSERGGYRVR